MKKIILAIILFMIMINVNAKDITLDICKEGNCDCKDIDEALTKAEDYGFQDTVTIILKDDYQVYQLDSHDLNAKVNIINNSNKKLDLIEINGVNNCIIKLKNPLSITNKYNNKNGEFDLKNITFKTEEFRGDNTLLIFNGDFILKNINIDGYTEWEDYLRNLNNLDNFSYDEVYGITFNNSKVNIDGINITKFINGIINNNSNITIKNSDISNNVYSIYNNSGNLKLDYTKSNSLIIGKIKKSNIDITGSSEFLHTIKLFNKEPSKYIDYKDYSNIILLNNSTYNMNLKVTKNIGLKGEGISLKRVFPVIDGVNYDKLEWNISNKAVVRIDSNRVIPINVGKTEITTEIKGMNVKYTVIVKVFDQPNTVSKYIIIVFIIIMILYLITRKKSKNE